MKRQLKQSTESRLWNEVDKTSVCWLWTGLKNPKGYGVIWHGEERRQRLAHRVSWELFNGEVPKGLWVLHHCDNPSCVKPDHLFLGTNSDNVRDRTQKGRSARLKGEKNPLSKLTDESIREIRKLYFSHGETLKRISRKYDVSVSAISLALRNKTWAHVNS